MKKEMDINESSEVIVDGSASMSKEVKSSAVTVTRNEARFLVDTYYQMQNNRIIADNQIRAIVQAADDQSEEIPKALKWVSANMRNQEEQIKKMLDAYTKSKPVGQWCQATIGVGPVLAAGCLSYFDIEKVSHYNQFWSYAGLNDYNNPWLGKEKSSKIVKDIYTELEKRDKKISKLLDIRTSVKELKKKFKPFASKDYFGAGEIYDWFKENNISDNLNDFIHEYGEDPDILEDYLIRTFINANAVTDYVICKVMEHVKRPRRVIINGLNNMINTKNSKKDKPIQYIKSDLTAYLAKPPYNSQAKQLVYLLGESFVKVSGKEKSLYGRIYKERKAMETVMNEELAYRELAEKALSEKNYGKDTESYKAYIQGKLPAIQIYRRAKRHAAQLFLSHLFEAMYMDRYGKEVPHDIYPISHLGHSDYIAPEVAFSDYIKI